MLSPGQWGDEGGGRQERAQAVMTASWSHVGASAARALLALAEGVPSVWTGLELGVSVRVSLPIVHAQAPLDPFHGPEQGWAQPPGTVGERASEWSEGVRSECVSV